MNRHAQAPRENRRPAESRGFGDVLIAVVVLAIIGLWIGTRSQEAAEEPDHRHREGLQGGVIASFAQDRGHAEAFVEEGGVLRVLMLGRRLDEVIDVALQEPVAYIDSGNGAVTRLALLPDPQPFDADGRTSQFAARLPDALNGRRLSITVSGLQVGEGIHRLAFTWPKEPHDEVAMPTKVADDAERELYLTPGGAYTEDDIEANGGLTASEKFRGFRAKHDFNPASGDAVCPISRTKANEQCAWVIGGRRYTFCCPPCIDEFVLAAKQEPQTLKPPEEFVQQ